MGAEDGLQQGAATGAAKEAADAKGAADPAGAAAAAAAAASKAAGESGAAAEAGQAGAGAHDDGKAVSAAKPAEVGEGDPAGTKGDDDGSEPAAKRAKTTDAEAPDGSNKAATDANDDAPAPDKGQAADAKEGKGAAEATTTTDANADTTTNNDDNAAADDGTARAAAADGADNNADAAAGKGQGAAATDGGGAAGAGAAATGNAAANANPTGGGGDPTDPKAERKGSGNGNNNGNGNGNGNGGVGKTGDNMGGQKRAEIYTYNSKDMVYSLAWSVRKDKKFRLAAGSFVEEYVNKVEILYLDETKGELGLSQPSLSFQHPFPATKIMFIPETGTGMADLLATGSDYIRIYRIDDTKDANSSVEMKSVLSNSSNSEFCAPLTSFDWNEDDLNKIGTSSIDTTCTIWDIEKEVVDTQLIAHDREVYDIAWGGAGVFASVSADGSVRVFDLRDKEHSTIIYESPHPEVPLVRLGWNKQDPRYMATILMDSSKVIILDIRFPTLPVAELQRHQASVNALAWAPHSSCHICTAGDDNQALIWDLSSMNQPLDGSLDPILAYHAGAEINNLQWSSAQPDWVAIAFANNVQILRV